MPRQSAPSTTTRAVHAALARHGFPKKGGPGLCFTKEGDELFARGYPHLRLLSDERVETAAAIRTATQALDAIDPCFRLTVPREVARCYLLGHSIGTGLFIDEGHSRRRANLRLRPLREARMESDTPVDVRLLQEALEAQGHGMGDTYSQWRWPKVLYLYEAFLGTEPVARTLVEHLVRNANEPSRWDLPGHDVFRMNAAPTYLAQAFPWLCRRLELGRARPPSDDPRAPRAHLALLQAYAGKPVPDEVRPWLDAILALDGDDVEAFAKLLDLGRHTFLWNAGRTAWVVGTERFAGPLPVAGTHLDGLLDSVAPIEDAGIVRLVAAIAGQRAGKKAAAGWLRVHAAYARPILDDLHALDDEKERKNAAAALALLDDEKPVKVHVPTRAELEREIAAIFAALGKKLKRTKDVDRQKEAIRAAHEKYTEARAAAGDPIPEAYFTHRFVDFDLAEYGELAADALE